MKRHSLKPSKLISNESGLALVFVVIVIPLLAALLLIFAKHLKNLTQILNQIHSCETAMIKANETVIQELERIEQLNPQVLALRKQKRLARWAVKMALASGNPAVIASARAQLMMVETQEKIVRARQLFSVNRITITWTQAHFKVRNQIQSSAASVISQRLPSLPLKEMKFPDGPPIYEPRERSFHYTRWTLLWNKGQKFKSTCGSALERKGKIWNQTLIEDKFY
ncbi:MAG: hypothetical protein ACK5RO_09840 [Pseudobdellovibrionaceae bacterium]|jgi:hypothetical protein